MKFKNGSYLDSLTILVKGNRYEYTNLSKYKVQCLCATHNIDLDVIVALVEDTCSVRSIIVDLDIYQAAKKENEMNSTNGMNIGSEIVYVTPAKLPRLQTMAVTRENIILAAQWCGATEIHIPSGPARWSFGIGTNDGGELTVHVGEVLIRESDGSFSVLSQDAFRAMYDRV